MGFDTAAEPFISDGRVLRGIYQGHAAAVREVLSTCVAHDLFSHGIVATRELADNPHPELGYETILEHARVPFVTYPHEWSASMFADAAVFHVELFERLQRFGLTLKDWHPYNILFDGTRPVFVDFMSIIPVDSLPDQEYLSGSLERRGLGKIRDATANSLYEMYLLLFEPYFGLPLAMMSQGRHAEARRRIFETTLNTGNESISKREAFAGNLPGRLKYELAGHILQAAVTLSGREKNSFFSLLRRYIGSRKVAVSQSAYSTYYEEKNEVFSAQPAHDWTNKQTVVHDAIVRLAPRTVLDLGSNTGWFSMLAATLGCSVVAVDLDEACIDRLFLTARRDKLSILPLVANLTAPLPELYGKLFEGEPSRSLIGNEPPLIQSPVERLRCDMVLALAVVHHLALGQALTFGGIASILSSLSERYLCVEFVAIEDRMIAGDPSFFPAYDAAKTEFGWYTQENFIAALRVYFSAVEVLPSYPDSRSLLVCSK